MRHKSSTLYPKERRAYWRKKEYRGKPINNFFLKQIFTVLSLLLFIPVCVILTSPTTLSAV